jgi:hypothetical protein
MNKARSECVAPASDRLVPQVDFLRGVGHNYAALKAQLFNVAQAQLKAEVHAHGAIDDCDWKPVTVIGRFRFLHLAISLDQPNNLTMPCIPSVLWPVKSFVHLTPYLFTRSLNALPTVNLTVVDAAI